MKQEKKVSFVKLVAATNRRVAERRKREGEIPVSAALAEFAEVKQREEENIREFFTSPKAFYSRTEFAELLGYRPSKKYDEPGEYVTDKGYPRAAVCKFMVTSSWGVGPIAAALASLEDQPITIPASELRLLMRHGFAERFGSGDEQAVPLSLNVARDVESALRELIEVERTRVRFRARPAATTLPTAHSVVSELIVRSHGALKSAENPNYLAEVMAYGMLQSADIHLNMCRESIERRAMFMLKELSSSERGGLESRRGVTMARAVGEELSRAAEQTSDAVAAAANPKRARSRRRSA